MQLSPPLDFKFIKDRNCDSCIFVSLISNTMVQLLYLEIVSVIVIIIIIMINILE
jgi:hypothetical protein